MIHGQWLAWPSNFLPKSAISMAAANGAAGIIQMIVSLGTSGHSFPHVRLAFLQFWLAPGRCERLITLRWFRLSEHRDLVQIGLLVADIDLAQLVPDAHVERL